MKYFLLSLFILTGSLYSQAVGVLFDNSGSMHQFYPSKTLEDGKQLILDLVFQGNYDQNLWKEESINPQFRATFQHKKPLWNSGDMLYLHAFGEVDNQFSLPFFRQPPYYRTFDNASTAITAVQNQLFARLDFGENYTHSDIADLVAWKYISEYLPERKKKNYCYLVTISDFVADPNVSVHDVEQELLNQQTVSQTTPVTYLILSYTGVAPNAPKPLKMILTRLEWQRPEDEPTGDTTPVSPTIRLINPPANHKYEVTDKLKQIPFSWSNVEGVETYNVHIRQVEPPRSIGVFSTRLQRYNLDLRSLSKADKVEIEWHVEADQPGGDGRITSSKSRFSIEKSGDSIWGILVLLALIAAAIFLVARYGNRIGKTFRRSPGPSESHDTTHEPTDNGDDDY
ncbi:MAG: hypothetical protein KDH98_08525 [Calditrichaeota bacterium]|nr:hypothetical protein [Calditrichota bacterium]